MRGPAPDGGGNSRAMSSTGSVTFSMMSRSLVISGTFGPRLVVRLKLGWLLSQPKVASGTLGVGSTVQPAVSASSGFVQSRSLTTGLSTVVHTPQYPLPAALGGNGSVASMVSSAEDRVVLDNF